MGEIADGLINGDFDSLTGEYLGEGCGFPRTTDFEHAKSTGIAYVGNKIIDWDNITPDMLNEKFDKFTYGNKATYGVHKLLKLKGYSKKQRIQIVKQFTDISGVEKYLYIQQNFDDFMKFLKKIKKLLISNLISDSIYTVKSNLSSNMRRIVVYLKEK